MTYPQSLVPAGMSVAANIAWVKIMVSMHGDLSTFGGYIVLLIMTIDSKMCDNAVRGENCTSTKFSLYGPENPSVRTFCYQNPGINLAEIATRILV